MIRNGAEPQGHEPSQVWYLQNPLSLTMMKRNANQGIPSHLCIWPVPSTVLNMWVEAPPTLSPSETGTVKLFQNCQEKVECL